MKNNKLNAINLALACAIGVIGAGSLVNDSNPFNQQDLTNGYENGHTTLMGKLTIAESKNTETVEKHAEGKCGEGKCGESKADEKHAEGKCGEGKCGESKADEKHAEGKCGEGKCGESKADEKHAEGKCGS